MRLLIVYHAGMMQNARAIYREFAEAGVDLTVIVPERVSAPRVYDPSGYLVLENGVSENGYRLVPVPLRSPNDYVQGYEPGPLNRAIAEFKPDLIQVLDEAFSPVLRQIALNFSRRVPVVFYAFENIDLHRGIRFDLPNLATWKFVAGGAAANSDAIRNLYAAGFPASRPIRHIPWGIPLDVFHPRDREESRLKIGLTAKKVVGFAGRISEEKGIEDFVGVLELLGSDIPTISP